MHFSSSCLRNGVPLVLATLLHAQGVGDTIVVAGCGNATDGRGGLFQVLPSGTGQSPLEIAGLPDSLTGEPLDGTSNGASAIAALDGVDLIVGSAVDPGGTVELFVIRVSGSAANVRRQIAVGVNTGTAVAGIQEIEVLPNGDVLAIADAAIRRAGADAELTLVSGIDSTNPVVTTFSMSGAPVGAFVGAAIDEPGQRVFLAIATSAVRTEIVATPLSGGGAAAVPIAAIAQRATGMTLDSNGLLVVSSAPELIQIDPSSASQEVIRSNLRSCSAVATLEFNDRIMLLRRHPRGARNFRVSTMRSQRRNSGFNTLTRSSESLGDARDLAFVVAPPPPPPPPPPTRLQGNPGGNVLVAAEGSSQDGRGGLFLLNPTQFEAGALPIGGLPDALVGLPLDGTSDGARSVFVRQSDQNVFVGSGGSTIGNPVEVFQFTINADQATLVRRRNIGEIAIGSVLLNNTGINQIDELPDGNLIAVSSLGVVRRQGTRDVPVFAQRITPTGATRFQLDPEDPIGDYTGVAVDRSRDRVYIAVVARNGTLIETRIISVASAGGTFVTLALLRGEVVTGLAMDNANQLLAATVGAVFRIDPDSGTQAVIQDQVGGIEGVANADPTGEMLLLFEQQGDQVATQDVEEVNGSLGFLTRPGESMGNPKDLHILPSPHIIARGTPGQNAYTWAVAPNPGGMAFPGNTAFSLTLTTDATTMPPGAALFAPTTNPVQLLGLSITVDLATAFAIPLQPAGDRATVPLPIPATPSVVDLRGFLQALLLDPSGNLASSDTVTFRVL